MTNGVYWQASWGAFRARYAERKTSRNKPQHSLPLGVAESVFLASLCHDIVLAYGVEVGVAVEALDLTLRGSYSLQNVRALQIPDQSRSRLAKANE